VDHIKSFLPLWLRWSPLKTTPSSSSSLAFLSLGFYFSPPPMALPFPPPQNSPSLKSPSTNFLSLQVPQNSLFLLPFPSLPLPSSKPKQSPPHCPPLPLPPRLSPVLSTSPTKSQTPISVAGASSARVENVRFGQKVKGRRGVGKMQSIGIIS